MFHWLFFLLLLGLNLLFWYARVGACVRGLRLSASLRMFGLVRARVFVGFNIAVLAMVFGTRACMNSL